MSITARRGSGSLPALPEPTVSAPQPPAPDVTAPAEPPPAGPVFAADIRRRLETLKRLYEDDLITEQEYARERAEVLEAF